MAFICLLCLEITLRALGWIVSSRDKAPRAGGGTRILCLGDSFTYGIGADDPAKHSYPRQLQSRFDEAEGCDARVINRGIPGNNSSYIRAHVEEDILKFQPRVILLMAGVNNLWNATDAYTSGGNPDWRDRLDSALFGLKSYRFYKIARYNIAWRAKFGRSPLDLPDDYDRVKNVFGNDIFHLPRETIITEGGRTYRIPTDIELNLGMDSRSKFLKAIETLIRDLDEIKEISDRYGVTLVLLTYPHRFRDNYALMEFGKRRDVPVIDNMKYVYDKITVSEMPEYFAKEREPVEQAHPNEKGYALMADNISSRLPEIDPRLKNCAPSADAGK